MKKNQSKLVCTLGCWAVAALAALLALVLLMVVGGWTFMQSVFVGVIVFVIIGAMLSTILCKPLPQAGEVSAPVASDATSAASHTTGSGSTAGAAASAQGSASAAADAGSGGTGGATTAGSGSTAGSSAESAGSSAAGGAASSDTGSAAESGAGSAASSETGSAADSGAGSGSGSASGTATASAAASGSGSSGGAGGMSDSAAAAIGATAGVTTSTQLSGQTELAERKGSWTYKSESEAKPSATPASTGGASDAASVDTHVESTPDFDGDGIREGLNEGSKPSILTGPRAEGADDLKQIKGIGPKLEKAVNSIGVYHFDQIAAWSDDEVAWVNANLIGFKGRVTRDNWVSQAKVLAEGGETEFSKKVEKGGVYD